MTRNWKEKKKYRLFFDFSSSCIGCNQAHIIEDLKVSDENLHQFSFNKVLAQKEELEQKHLHLLQIVESEKTAKWQYTQQCEEFHNEIKQLRTEVRPHYKSNL